MMSRMSALALSASFAFFSSACAAETQDTVTNDVSTAPISVAAEGFTADSSAWRDVNPENTLYLDSDYGRIVIELYPELAPNHVERIKKLARLGFYNGLTFHRVIEDFMNQTGDPDGNGTGSSTLPDMKAEFTFRRGNDMPVTLVGAQPINPRNPSEGEVGVGFYKAMPVATQPSSQAILTKDGKVNAFGIHCKGITSMARSGEDTGNSQFFLMRGTAPWLDSQYSIWGTTVAGHDLLTKFKVGTVGETAGFTPDKIKAMTVAADVPADRQVKVQILRTNSADFKRHLSSLKKADGSYPDICDIPVPTRIQP